MVVLQSIRQQCKVVVAAVAGGLALQGSSDAYVAAGLCLNRAKPRELRALSVCRALGPEVQCAGQRRMRRSLVLSRKSTASSAGLTVIYPVGRPTGRQAGRWAGRQAGVRGLTDGFNT